MAKYNVIYDTPRVNETLVATRKADAFVFDAAAVDDNPDWSSGGHVQTDTIVGFDPKKDVIIFTNTNYAISQVQNPGLPPNEIYYNNDPGGTDWDSLVRVYDTNNNPVSLTEGHVFIVSQSQMDYFMM